MSKSNIVRGVAFDLDGTLVDSAPGLTSAVDKSLYALELPQAGEDRVVTWIGNGAEVLMERALNWAMNEKHPGKTVDEHQLRMMRKLFDSYYAEEAQEGSFLFPAVADSLAALNKAGIPLAVVTNKPTPFVAPILESLGIASYFDIIVGGDDVTHKKPHPEPILKVLEQLKLTPESLVFVGDSRNDIQAARAAGCRCIGLSYGYNYGESISLSEPDIVLDEFQQLLPALGLSKQDNQELTHE
ncbi:phosphoglycolate phosphatase [Salmonella enterica subsp. enterica serovar Choleraesuis]|nr:phosphoglycolate phosphatase [Salmonella enterica subsp. enterica serovar Choleraesuis]